MSRGDWEWVAACALTLCAWTGMFALGAVLS